MAKSETSASESDGRISSDEDEMGSGRNQGKMSEYEKIRLKRIKENKIRMEALGLRKMATAVQQSQKMGNDRKGKKKMEDEDEEYNPGQEQDDNDEMSSSGQEDRDDDEEEEFSLYQKKKKKKVKRNISTPKKRGHIEKPISGSNFVEDNDDLMRAIALSLQDSSGVLDVNNSQNVATPKITAAHMTTSDKKKENVNIRDDSSKRKRKKLVKSRVQMSEDEVLVHFFQLDETGNGSFTLRDLRRLAVAHDFTWSEKEMADMITCFDSDGDGKINFDDFCKIVCRCNMLKGSEDGNLGIAN